MSLIAVIFIVWACGYAAERTKSDWRGARDKPATEIAKANPSWSDKRVRRAANRRALTWWGHELAHGLPTFRGALAEDWQHVSHLRETGRLAGERRMEHLKDELQAIRDNRAAHRDLVKEGKTPLSFVKWLDAGRPGLPGAEAKEQKQPAPAPAAAAPGTPPVPPVPPAPQPAPAAPSAPAQAPAPAAERHLRPVPDPDSTAPQAPAPQAPAPPAGDPAQNGSGTTAEDTPARPGEANPNGGSEEMSESMEAPSIAAAKQVVANQATQMQAIVANSEQLVNDMLAGGMNNDPQTMSAIQAAQEATSQAAASWQAALQGLQAHAAGEEYANSGKAASTEWLKES